MAATTTALWAVLGSLVAVLCGLAWVFAGMTDRSSRR